MNKISVKNEDNYSGTRQTSTARKIFKTQWGISTYLPILIPIKTVIFKNYIGRSQYSRWWV